jgi:ribosomal protein S18 acetylase RimI-like enzyme
VNRLEQERGALLPGSFGGEQPPHSPAIRPATPIDADKIVALWQACDLTRPWNDPHRDFALAVAGSRSTVLLTENGAGSVMVGFDGHRGWIYYLAVATDARRRGLGRALMSAAEAWLREQGAPKLQLMVREGNADALAFYAALGLERQPGVTLGRFLDDQT